MTMVQAVSRLFLLSVALTLTAAVFGGMHRLDPPAYTAPAQATATPPAPQHPVGWVLLTKGPDGVSELYAGWLPTDTTPRAGVCFGATPGMAQLVVLEDAVCLAHTTAAEPAR